MLPSQEQSVNLRKTVRSDGLSQGLSAPVTAVLWSHRGNWWSGPTGLLPPGDFARAWLLLRLASKGTAEAGKRLSSLSEAKDGRTQTRFLLVTDAVHLTNRKRSPDCPSASGSTGQGHQSHSLGLLVHRLWHIHQLPRSGGLTWNLAGGTPAPRPPRRAGAA